MSVVIHLCIMVFCTLFIAIGQGKNVNFLGHVLHLCFKNVRVYGVSGESFIYLFLVCTKNRTGDYVSCQLEIKLCTYG